MIYSIMPMYCNFHKNPNQKVQRASALVNHWGARRVKHPGRVGKLCAPSHGLCPMRPFHLAVPESHSFIAPHNLASKPFLRPLSHSAKLTNLMGGGVTRIWSVWLVRRRGDKLALQLASEMRGTSLRSEPSVCAESALTPGRQRQNWIDVGELVGVGKTPT